MQRVGFPVTLRTTGKESMPYAITCTHCDRAVLTTSQITPTDWVAMRGHLTACPNWHGALPPSTLGDILMNFVFPDHDSIRRVRFFLGFKLRYYLFSITAEAAHTLSGSTVDKRTRNGVLQETKDQAGSQQTYSVSLSMDL